MMEDNQQTSYVGVRSVRRCAIGCVRWVCKWVCQVGVSVGVVGGCVNFQNCKTHKNNGQEM